MHQYVLTGSRRKIAALEEAAEEMVDECDGITLLTKSTKETSRKLKIGKIGDATYGLKLRYGFRKLDPDETFMVATDIVIIRSGNAMIAIEHDGHVGQLDPKLTKIAAQAALKRLQKALKGS